MSAYGAHGAYGQPITFASTSNGFGVMNPSPAERAYVQSVQDSRLQPLPARFQTSGQNSNRARAQEAQKKMEPGEDPTYSKFKDAIGDIDRLLSLTSHFDARLEYFNMLRQYVIAASKSLTRLTNDSGWDKLLNSKNDYDPMITTLFQAIDYIDFYGRNAASNLPHLTQQFVHGLYGHANTVKRILGILLNEYMEYKKIGNSLNRIGAETRAMEKARHAMLNSGKNVTRGSWASAALNSPSRPSAKGGKRTRRNRKHKRTHRNRNRKHKRTQRK
jgi:hypothetical protein